MDSATVILALVVITALAFDFTNGFHDTANAMATSIATGALRPKVAVALSAVLNLVGAFLSVEVALTVTNAVVKIQDCPGRHSPQFLDNGGSGAAADRPGRSGRRNRLEPAHLAARPAVELLPRLFGGLIGATVAGLGFSGVNWTGDGTKLDGVVGKVILPALMSPVLAALVAAAGTWLIYRIAGGVAQRFTGAGLPLGPDRAAPRWSPWRTAPTTHRRRWA